MFPLFLFSSARSLHRSLLMRASKKAVSEIDTSRVLTPLYKPRGPNQKLYVKHLADPKVSVLLGVGPAGTGKTLFACSAAVQEMRRGAIQKIILTRPVVPVEEDIGFLPGNLIRKMDPWTRPVFDILAEFYSQKDIDAMLHSGAIEISPLAYMRGRTFKRAFVIADEMQNSSPNQMLMLATRLGEASKMVITGDLKQSDRAVDNGLLDLMTKLRNYSGHCDQIRLVEMEPHDVQRSEAVAKILDIYSFPTYSTTSHPSTTSFNSTTSHPSTTSFNSTTPILQPNVTKLDIKLTSLQDCALIPKNHISRHFHSP
jgi:phosphate starvation-inducible PhoH-like protein